MSQLPPIVVPSPARGQAPGPRPADPAGTADADSWRNLFDDSPAIRLLIDPADGRILDATRVAAAFYGYERETLRRMRIDDINTLPPDVVRARLHQTMAAVDGTRYFRFPHRLASGDVRMVDVYAGPVRFGGRLVIEANIHDVTGDAEAQAERDRLATAVEQSAESVVITDAQARIVYVNPAFERMTGYSRAEVIGANPRILKSGLQSATFYDAMWAALSNGLPWVADMTNRRKDGTLFQEEAVFTPIRRADGVIDGYVAVKRDVTRERALEAAGAAATRERGFILETLRSLPVGMPLEASGQAVCRQVVSMTGLTHAHLFLFGESGRAYPVGLATADGRTADDDELSEARTAYLRERATAGPWLEDWSPTMQHPYSDLLRSLGVRGAAYVPLRSDGALIGVLIAGAQTAAATSTLSTLLPGLIDFADVAGALLSPMLAVAAASDQARDRLHAVIDSRAFDTVFQPIVDLSTGVAAGYEALTRFRDGTPPDLAFAEAHRLGLGLELERATLRRAVAAAVVLPATAFLSLNVSPALVVADDGVASRLPDDGRHIVLEVTEHDSVPDYDAFRKALSAAGDDIGLAVDDAGSGVANFDHLVGLRPRFIKVDAALVRGVDGDPSRQALIVALLHFAHATGARVVAEGIEIDNELRCLVGLGVELGQGYLLGRPAPARTWRALDRGIPSVTVSPAARGRSRACHTAPGRVAPGPPPAA